MTDLTRASMSTRAHGGRTLPDHRGRRVPEVEVEGWGVFQKTQGEG